ncbi:MAG: GNAT family N-acetyltransferase [Gaiellaceae bacterium]
MDIRPASELSTAELAGLFTSGYEEYAYPVQLDEAGFSALAELSDFDVGRSRVAFADGVAVGISVIGVRGDEGWIGGLGVIPSARRQGVGRELMEAVVDAADVGRVSLEVLEPNVAAIALYQQLGFEQTRMLEVWSLSADAGDSIAEPDSVERAIEWIRAHRRAPEPWQRADESVQNLIRGGTELKAVSLPGHGAALYRVIADVASVLQLAAVDEDAAAQLLATVRGRAGSLRFVNVPEGDLAAGALQELGGRLDVRQLELALTLDT